jgi:hypothetical protein
MPHFFMQGSIMATKMALAYGYTPHNYDIICGRGRDVLESIGNRRFRLTASVFIEKYAIAKSKTDKSHIVARILDIIHDAGGRFIKHEEGRWWDIGYDASR